MIAGENTTEVKMRFLEMGTIQTDKTLNTVGGRSKERLKE